jgi:hypothetical protein
MYKVIITDTVRAKVKRYGDAYLHIFVDRFSDTWLWIAENIIQRQYIELADVLVDSIYSSLEDVASRPILHHAILDSMHTSHTRLGSRRIDFSYEEDEWEKIRYITDIEILRK